MQIIHAISSAIEVVKSTDGTRSNSLENLRKILQEWEEMLEKVADKKYVPIRQVCGCNFFLIIIRLIVVFIC